jgi:2-polyprenyl-3-methyl-5-hydroxy-6-metoxy-1,4-benzoquinol methylase
MEREDPPSAADDVAVQMRHDPELDLTLRVLTQTMGAADDPDLSDAPLAKPGNADPSDLSRLRETADLFGFAITANRPILGVPLLKRALRRLQYQVFARQSDFNDAATRLIGQLAGAAHQTDAERRVAARALTGMDRRLSGIERRLEDALLENARLSAEVQRQRVTLATRAEPEVETLDYVGLQARIRGTPDEIAERQRRYLELFREGAAVLDIGCGRGEFLGLLRDSGREATGVDTEPDMVELCRADGFAVANDDGLHHLSGLDDESLDGVFAAQVVEHLRSAQVAGLMQTALRKLRPEGVLVLETVNPTSLVALMDFSLDFTHVAPIHPLALAWLAESSGFDEVSTIYLSPVEGGPRLRSLPDSVGSATTRREFDDAVAATNEVLYGPREYALIARKS